jgi:hypothetical protein
MKTLRRELKIQNNKAKRNPKNKILSGIGIKTKNPKIQVKP